MRQQWRRFRRLLIGAITAVWIMCTSGVLYLRSEDPEVDPWFFSRMALLIMLVTAFAGYEQIMGGYQHAIEQRYRFFSYGDAMFITRSGERG